MSFASTLNRDTAQHGKQTSFTALIGKEKPSAPASFASSISYQKKPDITPENVFTKLNEIRGEKPAQVNQYREGLAKRNAEIKKKAEQKAFEKAEKPQYADESFVQRNIWRPLLTKKEEYKKFGKTQEDIAYEEKQYQRMVEGKRDIDYSLPQVREKIKPDVQAQISELDKLYQEATARQPAYDKDGNYVGEELVNKDITTSDIADIKNQKMKLERYIAGEDVGALQGIVEGLPEANPVRTIGKSLRAYSAAKKPEEERTLDEKIALAEIRGSLYDPQNLSYQVGNMIPELVATVGEYALTSGVAPGFRATVEKGAREGLEKVVKGKAVDLGSKAAGALVQTAIQTAIMPNTYETILQLKTPQVGVAWNGDQLLSYIEKQDRSWLDATLRGYGLAYTETLVERFGEAFAEVGIALSPKQIDEAIKLSAASRLMQRAGIQGFASEIAEEEITALLQSPLSGESYELPFTSPEATRRFEMEVIGIGIIQAGFKIARIANPDERIEKVKNLLNLNDVQAMQFLNNIEMLGEQRTAAYQQGQARPGIDKPAELPKKEMTDEELKKFPKEEKMLEDKGWQEGDRVRFDRAFLSKDTETLQTMLDEGRVPEEYRQEFDSQLQDMLAASKKTKSQPLQEGGLIYEAKKYKTADEFVKAQGTPVYRGDATPIKLSEMDTTKVFNPAEKEALGAFNNTPGLYFTDSVSNAKSYGKNLTEVFVKPNANVINVSDAPKILKRADVERIIRSNPRIKDWAMNWDENFDKAIKQITDSVMAEKDGNEFLKAIWSDGGFSEGDFVKAMQDAGIDGLKVPKEGVNHFVIYNKNILQTTSQLTDFWNQANPTEEQMLEGKLPEQITPGEQRVGNLRGPEDTGRVPKPKRTYEAGDIISKEEFIEINTASGEDTLLPYVKTAAEQYTILEVPIEQVDLKLREKPDEEKLKFYRDMPIEEVPPIPIGRVSDGKVETATGTHRGLVMEEKGDTIKIAVPVDRVVEVRESLGLALAEKDLAQKEKAFDDIRRGVTKVKSERQEGKQPPPPATKLVVGREAQAKLEEKAVLVSPSKSVKYDYNKLPKQDRQVIDKIKNGDLKKLIAIEKSISELPGIDQIDELNTRKIKQTSDYRDWAKYAEESFDKDIHPALLNRHVSMTAERVAEYLDGGIGGRTYQQIVKPVYDAAVEAKREGNKIKQEVDKFKILEGSRDDADASLYAQNKIKDASTKAKQFAEYSRKKYDEFLERLNEKRRKLGVEEIKKRKDYVNHLNELNALAELFGGIDRVTINNRIKELKSQYLDENPGLSDTKAFERAKREVEGTTGIEMYISAKQPVFNHVKKRISEFEKNPSLIRSLGAYSSSALRYIYQAENVAKNKAYKDVLPANAKAFFDKWNTEQVAGRPAGFKLNPTTKRIIMELRGTLGANTILGNAATTAMQLTSLPQVVSLAGGTNTLAGVYKRLKSYISDSDGIYKESRTKAMRNLETDIGMGSSLIDSALKNIGKYEKARGAAAKTRAAIQVGRKFLMGIMEAADQFTVGATFEAFYRKGVNDGMAPQDAMEYADIMTGKTQANYFQEALPPFLNTIEGKVLAQFGTYGMNQWEMLKNDFGKDFKLNKKSPKSVKRVFKHFTKFLIAAYLMDALADELFGRQPFDLKDTVDELYAWATGESDLWTVFDKSKGTVANYLPFMSSVKFGSLPPVLEFGKDVINLTFGDNQDAIKALKEMREKWSFNVLMPFAGNQLKKSLQGIEATTDVDVPLISDVSRTASGDSKFVIRDGIDKARAFVFGPYSTRAAREYYEPSGSTRSRRTRSTRTRATRTRATRSRRTR